MSSSPDPEEAARARDRREKIARAREYFTGDYDSCDEEYEELHGAFMESQDEEFIRLCKQAAYGLEPEEPEPYIPTPPENEATPEEVARAYLAEDRDGCDGEAVGTFLEEQERLFAELSAHSAED